MSRRLDTYYLRRGVNEGLQQYFQRGPGAVKDEKRASDAAFLEELRADSNRARQVGFCLRPDDRAKFFAMLEKGASVSDAFWRGFEKQAAFGQALAGVGKSVANLGNTAVRGLKQRGFSRVGAHAAIGAGMGVIPGAIAGAANAEDGHRLRGALGGAAGGAALGAVGGTASGLASAQRQATRMSASAAARGRTDTLLHRAGRIDQGAYGRKPPVAATPALPPAPPPAAVAQ